MNTASKSLLKKPLGIMRYLHAIIELFYVIPAVIIIHTLMPKEISLWALYMTLIPMMLLGGLAGDVLKKGKEERTPAVAFFLSVIIGSAAMYGLLYFSGGPMFSLAWVGVLLTASIFYRGYALAPVGWKERIPIEYLWVSFGLTGAMYAITLLIPYIQNTLLYPAFLNVLLPYQELLMPITIISLTFNLLFNNVQQVKRVSFMGKSMMKLNDLLLNQLLVLILIALIGIIFFAFQYTATVITITLIGVFIVIMSYALRENLPLILRRLPLLAISGLLLVILYFLGNKLMAVTGLGAGFGGMGRDSGSGSGEDPSSLWKIAFYGGLAVLAIGALLFFNDIRRILMWIYRKLKAGFIRFWNWLQAKEKIDKGFVDETTSLNAVEDLAASAGRLKQWLQDRFNSTRWNDLKDNRERVRYLYSQLVLRSMEKGFTFRPNRTPSETVDDLKKWELDVAKPKKSGRKGKTTTQQQDYNKLSEVYNRVRYGNLDAEDNDVKRLKENL